MFYTAIRDRWDRDDLFLVFRDRRGRVSLVLIKTSILVGVPLENLCESLGRARMTQLLRGTDSVGNIREERECLCRFV